MNRKKNRRNRSRTRIASVAPSGRSAQKIALESRPLVCIGLSSLACGSDEYRDEEFSSRTLREAKLAPLASQSRWRRVGIKPGIFPQLRSNCYPHGERLSVTYDAWASDGADAGRR